jgi:nucleoside-diphosphate-sugar epimerase
VKRVIVTGAAGFIGANVARRLVAEGFDAFLLTLPSSLRWRLAELDGAASIVELDLADRDAVIRAVREIGPDWVLHLAAHGGYSWQTDGDAILRANVIGTANLLEACRRVGVEAFVNTGSSSEYGFKDHPPDETEPIEPTSVYAVAKAAATMLCRQSALADDLNVCTLRLYSTYGPWEEPKRLVPALAVEGLHGVFPPLVSPDTARDFVWVDDVVEAFFLAARTVHAERGAIYNVGTGVQTTVGEAAEIARDVLQIEGRPEWGSMAARSWDTNRWVADSTKIQRALGWHPSREFRDGFTAFAHWFRERPELLAFYRRSRG